MKKGIGYSIELVVSFLIIITFVIGSLQFQGAKSYENYRLSTTANDLSYTAKELGIIDEIAARGQTGTLNTFVRSITDKNVGIAGTIIGMPYREEINIGFHTDQYLESANFAPVTSTDKCEGNLDDIQIYHEQGDILKNQNDSLNNQYNTTLYLANTTRTSKYEYDALFSDKKGNCEFTQDEPYYIDDTFMWGNTESQSDIHFYEFHKGINGVSGNTTFYNATQVKRFQKSFDNQLNSLETDANVDLFNKSDSYDQFDLMIFRETGSFNPGDFEDGLSNSSALYLTNVSSDSDSVLDILDPTDYDFNSPQSGVQDISFNDYWASQKVKDYYMAQGNNRYVSYPAGGNLTVYQDGNKAIANNSEGNLNVVNHWTSTNSNSLDIKRIARTGYLKYPKYTDDQIDFLVAVSYWLVEEENEFNEGLPTEDSIKTSVAGAAGSQKKTPYQLKLRWN